MGSDNEGLLHLLKASSKKTVTELCNRIVATFSDGNSDNLQEFVKIEFSLDASDAEDLIESLRNLLQQAIYIGQDDGINNLFPENFHQNLKDLLTKVISDNQSLCRSNMIGQQVSFPRLMDFNWKLKKDSLSLVPSCVVELKTSKNDSVNVEMSKETLDTMLDCLTKIRDQISSVSQ